MGYKNSVSRIVSNFNSTGKDYEIKMSNSQDQNTTEGGVTSSEGNLPSSSVQHATTGATGDSQRHCPIVDFSTIPLYLSLPTTQKMTSEYLFIRPSRNVGTAMEAQKPVNKLRMNLIKS